MMMSTSRFSIALSLLAALALSGCTGAILGNLFVVFLTVGIFFGTLGLGRTNSSGSHTSRADQSAQDR